MDSLLLLTLTISLMFSGGQCYSSSESCSTVNGKTVCESQKSAGNVAGASSNAMTGQGGSYQDANAMTGNTYNGQSSSSRIAVGNMPPGGMGPGFAPFAGGFEFPFGAPTFGGGSGSPAGTSASDSANTRTGSNVFTSASGPDSTGAGGAFAGGFAGSGGFVGPAANGFAGSGVFVGGGFSPSFGVIPSFRDSSNVPFGTRESDFGNTGTASTFVTSGEVAGGFAGPSSGFAGFGSSGGFAGGGFPPSFGVIPPFRDSSNVPFGTRESDFGNTGTASTFVTSGSDGAVAGGFAGPSSGFAGFGSSGGFAGGGFPPSFGVIPPFRDSSNVPFGSRESDFGKTGTASTFVTSGSDGAVAGGFAGPSSGFAGFGSSGGFAGGGFPPSFGVIPTFRDSSNVPFGTRASDFGNTGTASTFVTSGPDGTGGFPTPFGSLPTFGDGSSVPSGTSASGFRNTGAVNTFVTTGSDGTGGITGASSAGFGFGGGGVFVGGGAIPGIPGFGTGGGVVVGNPAGFDPFAFVFGRR